MIGQIVERDDLSGKIKNFPLEIVQAMVDQQVRQGNKADVSVFQRYDDADAMDGGFNWRNTPQGGEFWEQIISKRQYSVFYSYYKPKNDEIVAVPLSFVKEAYSAACPEWKGKIEKHVPQVKPQEEAYSAGDILSVEGHVGQFIIARVSYDNFNLISLSDGNRFSNGGFGSSAIIGRSVLERFIGKGFKRVMRAGSFTLAPL